MKFNDDDLDRIGRAIAEAESKSSGEIRVVLAASTTRAERNVALLLAAAAAAGGTIWTWFDAWGHPEALHLILAATGPALVVFALAELVLRSPGHRARRAERRARLEFERQGVGDTKDKTGVLILISLGDRCVHLLADAGINARVPPTMWDDEVARILDGLKTDHATDKLCEVIADIGTELARHFPPAADDKNELPDRPVVS